MLPGAARERHAALAEEYAGSLTLGSGQFCTNPGLLFVPEDRPELTDAVAEAVGATSAGPALTARIRDGYLHHTAELDHDHTLTPLAAGTAAEGAWSVRPRVWQVPLKTFAAHAEKLTVECFGPAGLVVTYPDQDALCETLAALDGQLTASVHTGEGDRPAAARVAAVLRHRVGRLVHNGWPTGVAVCWAMHHGGPWPATTSAGHTSVGAAAIDRWLAPVAYQDWPDELLPAELQDANPLGLPRHTE